MLRVVALLCVVSVAGESQVVRDSTGVRITTYARGDRAPATWTLEPRPALRIGGASGSGPSELAGVTGVARLSDGRFVIANGTSLELRFFRADGTFDRTIGRKGSGPSEFDGLIHLRRSGDSLLVSDASGRIQLFGPDGGLLRTVPRPTMTGKPFVTWFGALADGANVLLGADQPFDTVSRRPLAMATVEAGGTPVATIRAYEVVRKAGRNMPLYLGPAARVGVWRDRICTGWTGTWEVTCWLPTGRALWRTQRQVPTTEVTEADRELFREGFRRMNTQGPKDRVAAIAAAFEFADERARFGRLEMSTTGEVWLSEFVLIEEVGLGRAGRQVPDRPVAWSILDRDGRWVASLTVPRGFHLLEAGPDYVVGVERDDDDVESVTVYRYRRGQSGRL